MTASPRPPLAAEFGRKAIHLATAALPLAWAYHLLTATQVRWLLGIAVPVALLVEWSRQRGGAFAAAFARWLGPLLRSHERAALTGATWLAIAMWGAVMLAPERAAIVALWAAAVGDASAALVGRSLARRGASEGKSIPGSAAAFVTTALGAVWLGEASRGVAAMIGAIAMLAERPVGPGDDNVRVALAVAAGATLLGLR